MDSNFKWAESLGISPEQIKAWCQDKKPNVPVLYHLMLQKHIDEEAYLHWARQEHGFASLGRSYFVSNHDAELWYAMKIEHQWSPWFLPLKIWDETLFVGCLHPPETPLNLSLPVHYILCPAAGLERLWKFYMGDMGVEVTQKTNFTVTNSPDPVSEKTSVKMPSELKIPSMTPPPPPIPAPTHAPKPISVAATPIPAAIPNQEALNSLDFAVVTPESGRAVPKGAKTSQGVSASTQQPANSFSFDFSNLSISKDGDTKIKHDTEPPPPVVPPTPPTPTFSGTVARFELVRSESSAPPTPPPTPTTAATPTPVPAPTPVKPKAPPPPPVMNLKPPVPPAGSVVKSGTPINLTSYAFPPSIEMAKNFEQVIAYVFKEMSSKYDKCLFAAYDGDKLKVAHWTSNCIVDTHGANQPLVVDHPNIFKIAHDTKKPFHGPVSPNDINKTFFATWNGSQIPVVTTIYPLVAGQILLGHLIGMSDKGIDLYSSLEMMSAFATQICNKSTTLAA